MLCPKCRSLNNKVIDSRLSKSEVSIRRRRQCLDCDYRFTTSEEIIRADLQVVKRDASREDFDRNKLINGLKKAIEKRPIESLQVELLISDVVATLEENFDQEVPSEKIGALIMERLKKIDKIAYVRYASVYKDFRDINELAKEVNKLK
jgi:transcriptional repressor NrdR